jgi:hypothetical protein
MISLLFCSYFRLDKGPSFFVLERNSSSHSRREKSKHRPSVLGISDIHFLFILKWMNRPVLSPPCGAIQKVKRDATLSLFFFPFCLSLMCGYPFFKKKSSRFFVVGYAKKKKTIEVKVWVVSSWATFTGHFYFFFLVFAWAGIWTRQLLGKIVINKWR